jgi:hypothetical protein
MTRHFFVAAALGFLGTACAAQHEFTQSGKIQVGAASTNTATLRVGCTPDPNGGALEIALIVPGAYTRKDFDYEDFEGPDAAASSKALSTLTWSAVSGKTTITHAAAGWYLDDAFNFGVSQLSHRREEPARLLNAIGGEQGQLSWEQIGFDDAKRKLRADFQLDAASAQRLHIAAAECLPQNMPMRK